MKIRKFPFFATWWQSLRSWAFSSYLFVPICLLAIVLFGLGVIAVRIFILVATMFYQVVGESSYTGIFYKIKQCQAFVPCVKDTPQYIVLLIKNIGHTSEYFLLLLVGVGAIVGAAAFMAAFLAGYARMGLDLAQKGKTELLKFIASWPFAPRILAASFLYLAILMLPIAFLICLLLAFFWFSSALAAAWLGWLGIDLWYIADVFVIPGIMFIVLPIYALSARLSLFPYFIVEQKMGVFESLLASFEVTAGNTLRMMLVSILFLGSFIAIDVIGSSWLLRILGSLLYLLFVAPFQVLLFARIYTFLAQEDPEDAIPY